MVTLKEYKNHLVLNLEIAYFSGSIKVVSFNSTFLLLLQEIPDVEDLKKKLDGLLYMELNFTLRVTKDENNVGKKFTLIKFNHKSKNTVDLLIKEIKEENIGIENKYSKPQDEDEIEENDMSENKCEQPKNEDEKENTPL